MYKKNNSVQGKSKIELFLNFKEKYFKYIAYLLSVKWYILRNNLVKYTWYNNYQKHARSKVKHIRIIIKYVLNRVQQKYATYQTVFEEWNTRHRWPM